MFGLAALGVLFLLLASRGRSSASSSSSSGTLNALRQRALEVVAEVVPSEYPDERFARLGWKVEPGSKATSCGALPGYMGTRLGDPTGITRWGVEGARTEGRKRGAWVEGDGKRRPAPGDILGTARSPDGIIVHVGVLRRRFVDEQGREIWETADAGQGPVEKQAAAFVKRVYDPRTNTLTRLDNGEPRYAAGWINLDAWPFPKGKTFAPVELWRYPAPEIDGAERDGARLAA